MSYVTFAFIAYALFAFTNVLDKVVLGHRRVDPLGYVLVSAAWSPLVLLTLPFARLDPPGLPRMLAAIAAGACFFWMLFPYFKAAERDEITRVAPLWELAPIFVWILARLTLGEELGASGGLAFSLLVVGGLLLAARRPRDLIVPSRTMLLMILATSLLAAHNTLAAIVVRGFDPVGGYLLIRSGMVLAAATALLRKNPRARLRATLRDHTLGTHVIIASTVLLSVSGFLFLMRSLQEGPVAIVSALSGVGGIFVLGFTMIVARIRPGLLVEETSRGILLQKLIALVLLGLGVALLSR